MKKANAVIGSVASATGVFLISLMALSCAVLSLLGIDAALRPSTINWLPLIPLAVYAIGIPVILIWLALIHWRGDPGILGAVIVLSAMGLLIQFRMGSYNLMDLKTNIFPVLPFAIGLATFLIGVTLTSKGRGGWMQALGWGAYIAAVGVLVAMLLLGRSYRGGIYLSGNINPTEVVKPLLVFFLATHLSQRQKEFSETMSGIPVPPFFSLLGLVFLWGVPMALTILLRDLGLVVLLNTILIIMLFAVAKRMGYLAIGLAGVAAVGFGMQFLSSHAQARFDVWLNPFLDPTGKGWQILQGLTAMYSGGWWGAGLGTGSPETVPIVTSDFIYAALAEEVGLVGCAILLVIYATFFSRGFRAAGASRTPFERLLCVGLTASLAMQTLLNVAGVTKALPMTGITLPFISHGGSSLITCLLIAGLICGLSDND
ncbi:MAG: FtsW/RodA/SpoVE family cell cycle protein [bacterium]